MRSDKDPLSVVNKKINEERFLEADVIKVFYETRKAVIRFRNTNYQTTVNLGAIDPDNFTNDKSRLLVYVSHLGGGVIPVAVLPNRIGTSSSPRVTLGDRYGATSWGIRNSTGQVVFSVDSLGRVTFGTYSTYSPIVDKAFITASYSTVLTNERLLVGGDGIDTYDGGPNSAFVISVDVTDLLGSGVTEVDNNFTLDWSTPTITAILPDTVSSAGSSTYPVRSDHVHGITCDAPSINLSVSSANAEGSSTYFTRSDHVHAITSSSNPGAAASILASSVAGELTLVGLTLTGLTASTAIYADATKKITSLANASGYLTNNGSGSLSWSSSATPSAHNILSASHGDTLTGTVVDGDVIIGNVTPKWSRLAISVPAANVRNIFGVDNGETRPSWKTALDSTNPTTLTVSTTAAPGTSLVFSHRDHAHAITSSSNPGAAASILASSAAGELTLVGLTLSGLTASTIIYSDSSKKITSLANSTGYLYNNGSGTLSWSSTAAPSAHNLLSTSHGDTLAGSVADGDVVIGNVTPKWSRLAISVPAANVRNIFGVDNGETRPSWKTALDSTNPTTLTVSTAAAPGTSLIFSHRDHAHAITSSSSPGAAASILASSAAGKLTLVGITLSGLTASTVVYSNASKEITSLANSTGYLYNNGSGTLSWASGVTPSAHNILSAEHGDTLADTVVDGDIIIGNVTPKWSRLARSVPAANVRNVLGIDNGETRPSWKTALDSTNPATLTVSTSATAGTSLVFSHRDHAHAITSSSNPGSAASILASDSDGRLRLTGIGIGVSGAADRGIYVYHGYASGAVYGAFIQGAVTGSTNDVYGAYSMGRTDGGAADYAYGYRGDVIAANGNIGTAFSLYGRCQVADGQTVTTCKTFNPGSPSLSGTGAITNLYGLYIDDMYQGGTLNYAIYTNLGDVRFGDDVIVSSGGSLTLQNLTASTLAYLNGSKTFISLANAAGYLTNNGTGTLSWSSGVTPSAHNILSAEHGDTLTDTVVDGDIIIGNATPKWSRLARSVPSANVRNVLGIDNGETRPSWKTALDSTNPTTLTVSLAAAPGTSLVFSHRDHAHAITSSSSPGAAASILASSAAGELTLVGLTLSGLTASTVIYSDASKKITSLANSSGYLYNNGSGTLSWSTSPGSSTFTPLSTPYTNSSFDGDSFSDTATPTKIENTSWSTTIPSTAKALLIRMDIQDSADPGFGLYFALHPTSTPGAVEAMVIWLQNDGADKPRSLTAIMPCTDGDIWYTCNASGTSTMDVWLWCFGYIS